MDDEEMRILFDRLREQLESEEFEQQRQIRLARILCALKSQPMKTADDWLLTPNELFGGLPPIDLVVSEYGCRQVLKVIRAQKREFA